MLQFDFREGGSYRFAYYAPDATTVTVTGSYSVIKPRAEIVFSWVIEPLDENAGIETEASVAITLDSSGSDLVVRPEKRRYTNAIERHSAGWRAAIDQSTALLAQEAKNAR